MRLVVTEKPSVARDLARVLGCGTKHEGWLEGNGLRITWCIGHLAELEDPKHYNPAWQRWSFDTLPMVPEQFALRLRPGVADQFRVIQKLMKDRATEDVVNACDAGREGELIFRYVTELADCKKPCLRLWTSSLTDDAIHDAWRRLRPAREYDRLGDAARSRSEADWLVGLNATRALTCLAQKGGGSQLLSVGRVQTPTLAMIVARDRAIEAFVPEPFWQVKARMEARADGKEATWEATFFQGPAEGPKPGDKEEEEAPRAERLPSQALADAIADAARGKTGTITDADRKRTREQPPLLYDLTSLQRRANERYGMSAQTTLAVAQALYEKHKLITYPRTDARHITPDQVAELPKILQGLRPIPVYAPFADAILAKGPPRPGKRVVNAEEVGDHHAILPTGRTPSPEHLSPDERRLFDLVARRLMAALSDDALFDVTTLIVAIQPDVPLDVASPLRFRARGRVCRDQGWRAVDPPGKSKDVDLPAVEAGDPATAAETKVLEGKTRPPRPHTDATILHAMETAGKDLDDAELARAMRHAGLGTPATRADILQTLIDREYVVRQQRDLRATDKGKSLIDAVPVAELKSAELTGRWEAHLAAVAEGRADRPGFMRAVVENLHALIDAIAAAPPPPAEAGPERTGAILGKCPKCGQPVREAARVFDCDAGRACGFVVFKTMAKRDVSARMVKQLLTDGKTPVVKGWKSKEGKEFQAGLVWQEDRVRFHFAPREETPRVEAPREETPREETPRVDEPPKPTAGRPKARDERDFPMPTPSRPQSPVGIRCPRCGQGRIMAGRTAWGCDRWREGCRFTLPFEEDGRRLSDGDAVARIAGT